MDLQEFISIDTNQSAGKLTSPEVIGWPTVRVYQDSRSQAPKEP